jgi:hypothetical protein
MRCVVVLEVVDGTIAELAKREPAQFARRLQDAVDHEFAYARIGAVRVVRPVMHVKPFDAEGDYECPGPGRLHPEVLESPGYYCAACASRSGAV